MFGHSSFCLPLKAELNTKVRSLRVCSFFPIIKLLFIRNATMLFLLVLHCWFPPILIVFFFFYLSMENVQIILKVKTTQRQARNINYPPLPHHAPCSHLLWGDHPQLLLFRCYVMSDSFATPRSTALQDLLCPWDFPGKNTGVGCHFLLQGIFLTQGSNSGVLHWPEDSLLQNLQGSTANLNTF